MDVSDIEGIIKRIEVVTETGCCKEVISNRRIIVMISRRAEDSQIEISDVSTIVLEGIVVLVPELIPSQVTEPDSIKLDPLAFSFRYLLLDVRLEEFIELIPVVSAVCKMSV